MPSSTAIVVKKVLASIIASWRVVGFPILLCRSAPTPARAREAFRGLARSQSQARPLASSVTDTEEEELGRSVHQKRYGNFNRIHRKPGGAGASATVTHGASSRSSWILRPY